MISGLKIMPFISGMATGLLVLFVYTFFGPFINSMLYYLVYVLKFFYSVGYYIFSIIGLSNYGHYTLFFALVGLPILLVYFLIKKL